MMYFSIVVKYCAFVGTTRLVLVTPVVLFYSETIVVAFGFSLDDDDDDDDCALVVVYV